MYDYLVGALPELLVVDRLLHQVEDLGGEGLVRQRVRLRVHLVVRRSHLDPSLLWEIYIIIHLKMVIVGIFSGKYIIKWPKIDLISLFSHKYIQFFRYKEGITQLSI